jgi:hypothetical protein
MTDVSTTDHGIARRALARVIDDPPTVLVAPVAQAIADAREDGYRIGSATQDQLVTDLATALRDVAKYATELRATLERAAR